MPTDVERLDAAANWIRDNQDKAGTPDFVRVADTYRQLRGASLPDVRDARAGEDPYSWGNTADRIFTNTVTAIPDLGIGIYNAGARAAGYPNAQADYLAPQMRANAGAKELPEDASTTRRLLEGGASALAGGGARAILNAPGLARKGLSFLSTTAAPTVASHYGGEVGGSIGDAMGDRETGALIGSLVGGGASQAPFAARGYVANRFAGMRSPEAPQIAAAAERQNVTPTVGMLGNEQAQRIERNLANKSGSSSVISTGRTSAIDDINAALDRAAVARGSTDAAPTAGTIGSDVAEVARTGRDEMSNISSAAQQQLMDRVGPRTEADVAGVLAAMEDIRRRTDPGTAAPIDARLGTLRRMLPVDDEGNVVSTAVPYERLKDWRTNLRERSQNYDAVPSRFAGEIYDETTGAMRGAAESAGVPTDYFDNVQSRTRGIMGPEGPFEQLGQVADSEPTQAYNYLRGGEQNPQRLRLLQATGNPELDRISGDYVRQLGNQTLGTGGARGPINFANRWEGMHPEARDVIGGRQVPDINDVATLARSFDYPTSQTGLGRTVAPLTADVAKAIIGSDVGAEIGRATGIPGAPTAGRLAGLGLPAIYRNLYARALQSPDVRDAMVTGRAPLNMRNPEVRARIGAVLAAVEAAQRQQTGQ
ncbi:hypothetical protein [Bradyrhizobium japonicum]|uniref:hypothetical protein n=1 Tax=Bradyrhizobium japonicum TaxID=375 RepID=UPI00200CA56E|nr:hypothetical protein [Bradyrhizobium japonicum]UQD96112.1 hypothetical protein JEY30_31715 [Bradyrhizobium japonicum]